MMSIESMKYHPNCTRSAPVWKKERRYCIVFYCQAELGKYHRDVWVSYNHIPLYARFKPFVNKRIQTWKEFNVDSRICKKIFRIWEERVSWEKSAQNRSKMAFSDVGNLKKGILEILIGFWHAVSKKVITYSEILVIETLRLRGFVKMRMASRPYPRAACFLQAALLFGLYWDTQDVGYPPVIHTILDNPL